MADIDLDALERLAEAAVRGPWEHRRSENAVYLGVAGSIWSTSGVFLGEITGRFVDVADFIASARTAVPALVQALRAERARADSNALAFKSACADYHAERARTERLVGLLREARDEIREAWSNCSSPYMREKHEDPTLLDRIDAEFAKGGE